MPGPGDVYTSSKVSVMRQRAVGDGFHEDLTVFNYGSEPIETELRIEAAADFADLFEVKDALAKKGSTYQRVEDGRIVLGYERETYRRETWISATAPEAEIDDEGIRFRIRVPPQASWTTCLEVVTAVDGTDNADRRALPLTRRPGGPADHEREPRRVDCRRADARVELEPARGGLPPEPGRSRRASLPPRGGPGSCRARSRPAVVHDALRP